MNNNNFLIEDSDLEFAKDICKNIEDSDIRNRAVANALAADIAKKYFTETEVDTESGLHCISQVLNDIDISDIYIKGSYIDVRLYFNDNELCIPKSHFDKDLLPVAYMFIRINDSLSGASVTGFIQPSNIDTTESHLGYYTVNEDDLVSFYDIEKFIDINYEDEDIPDNFERLIFDYLDGNIENADSFYKTLITFRELRIRLQEAATVQNIFNFVSKTASYSTTSDSTQDISNSEINTEEDILLSGDSIVEDILPTDDLQQLEELQTDTEELLLEPDTELEQTIGDDNEVLEISDTELSDNIGLIEELVSNQTIELELSSNTNTSQDFDILQETTTKDTELLEIEESPEPTTFLDITEEPVDSLNIVEDNFDKIDTTTSDIMTQETKQDILEEAILDNESDANDFADSIAETDSDNPTQNEFSTNITPNIDIPEAIDDDTLEKLLDNDASSLDKPIDSYEKEENTVEKAAYIENKEDENPQIQELFGNNIEETASIEDTVPLQNTKTKPSFIPIIGFLALIIAAGYFGYNKFNQNKTTTVDNSMNPVQSIVTTTSEENRETKIEQDAMPVESIENSESIQNTNEGNSISVPAIEQNLDASIMISNLSIAWEVPANYVSNNTAQRYFSKMGRIIQLNLKAELLLLNKPPITNKIMLEIEFNKNTDKFEVKSILASSGEKSVDDIIMQTVQKALDNNLKINTGVFKNIAGNPVLIIRL